MSLRTLPIIFLNMGGEMMYILDQRLRAQKIPNEKAKKVLNDIVSTMLSKRFIEELFKPQPMYGKKALRTVFDKLAHASIMRLNTASMDKLYDLMVMAFKYQTFICSQPSDLLLITLNHLDSIRAFVTGPSIQQQVCDVYTLLTDNYLLLSQGDFRLIRQSILTFFQDYHVRVSIFLRTNVQLANGRFVMPPHTSLSSSSEAPGTIRYLSDEGNLKTTEYFETGADYGSVPEQGSLDFIGDRVTSLGTNMYTASKSAEDITKTETVAVTHESKVAEMPSPEVVEVSVETYAKEELNFLADLLSNPTSVTKNHEFRLNFFTDDVEEENAARAQPVMVVKNMVNIDASESHSSEFLAKVMQEMKTQDAPNQGNGGDDLLDLLDLAAASE